MTRDEEITTERVPLSRSTPLEGTTAPIGENMEGGWLNGSLAMEELDQGHDGQEAYQG